MKNVTLLIIIFSLCSLKLLADDYMDTIATQACECIGKIDLSTDKKMLTTQLGLCMIDKARPYSEQLKRDYNLDFNNLNGPEGERLGQLIASRMTGICPQALIKFSQAAGEDEPSGNVSLSGQITDVVEGQFLTLKVKDSDGKVYPLLWLTYFQNSDEVQKKLKTIKGTKVSVEFEEQEFYDPKISDYRNFKIIKSLEIIR